MNPSEIVTLFFEKFQNLAAETAPRLVMKRRYIRNEGSYTAHFNPAKSLRAHPDLPLPSIFLQFRQANVKLLFDGWAPAIERINATGHHARVGFRIERIRGAAETVGIVADTPQIDPHTPFEEQCDRCLVAVQTTEQLCAWWDSSPEIFEQWANLASALGRAS